MRLKLAEIEKIVDGKLIGDSNLEITGVAPISEAYSSDITFVSHPSYEKYLAATSAGCVLVEHRYEIENKNFIIVKNPQKAFVKILEILQSEFHLLDKGVHPSAVISDKSSICEGVCICANVVIESGAQIGSGSFIGANCYIGRAVKIGKGCILRPYVTVYERCSLGARVVIHSGTVIGSDGFGYIKRSQEIKKIPQIGVVSIGDDVEIGANSTIDRATMGATEIGSGTKIDNLVQIAHNVKIGKNCLIASQTGIAGSTIVGDGVTMAGQVGVSGHLNIGDGATIAAQSGVICDIKPSEVVSGYPARQHMKALKTMAIIEKLPEIYAKIKKIKI